MRHCLGAARRAELSNNRRDVKLDRVLGYLQLPRDLFVPQTVRHHVEYLSLAGRELSVRGSLFNSATLKIPFLPP